jgi:putative phosphoserine phosphatase / 1-acylglycerol-3-phosphate O-acyltransferase
VSEAAFFDLDRTLIKGGSGPAIIEALTEAGLVPSWYGQVARATWRLYDVVGESRLWMELARRMVASSKGWELSAVEKASSIVAEKLDQLMFTRARVLVAEHRRAGRHVVLATTTAAPLLEAFVLRVGADALVATAWASDDERYAGRLDGPFLWRGEKARAVQRWAEHEGVDLRASDAYSDSVYDLPLLESVGRPHAVNPDIRLRAVAMLRRWPVLDFNVPDGVPNLAGIELYDAIKPFLRPETLPFARWRFAGLDHIPASGPVIIVANHRSYLDPVALALAAAKRGRKLRFLGKAEVFDAPLIGPAARLAGQIRVDRGSGSERPLEEAAALLSQGEAVVILPEGTIPREAETVPKGRPGAAKLAASSGAPVLPVGLSGTDKVWPRESRLPRVLTLRRPTVSVRAGPPVPIEGDDAQRDTERIMEAIRSLIP